MTKINVTANEPKTFKHTPESGQWYCHETGGLHIVAIHHSLVDMSDVCNLVRVKDGSIMHTSSELGKLFAGCDYEYTLVKSVDITYSL